MMPKRVDANQREIVAAARKAGLWVDDTHEVGRGFPDLVVSDKGLTLTGNFNTAEVLGCLRKIDGLKIHFGASIPVEIKTETGRMNKVQKRYHRACPGPATIVKTPEDLLRLFGKLQKF